MSENNCLEINYLALIAKMVSKYKHRTYELMQLKKGDKVLDVGCGPATDTITLASLVGETGQVFGVDIDEQQIMHANQKAVDAGVNKVVTHYLVNGYQLPFGADCFDSVRSERVFQHNADSNQLLKEMIRVTKCGGWIVVLDTDWSTMSIDTNLVDIEQKIKKIHVEKTFKNSFAGRQLFRMLIEEGLHDIHVEMAPVFATNYRISRQAACLDMAEKLALEAGVVSQFELDALHADLEKADFEGKYFSAILQVLVAGRKPFVQEPT
ncbi:MAG TPA: class I SAM-dependent methyltransferase [Candidatus Competibacter sp.]|nr:class I SAM-dependent methyltransferase [Candidatus Competibacter sp.]